MIARELLVKLGFNIDTAKFAQFKAMSEDVKVKMSSMQKAVSSSLSPDVTNLKMLSAYKQELKDLSSDERKDLLGLNRLEAIEQATQSYKQKLKNLSSDERKGMPGFRVTQSYRQKCKEVTQIYKQQHKEIEALEKARLARIQKQKEEFQGLLKGIGNIAKGITLVTGAASAGFALSLKSTLDDVKAFKSQKFHGEKTTSKFDKGQLKAVDEFNNSFDETKRIIAEVRNSFVIGLLPVISEVSKKFQGWVKLNKGLINSKLKSTINNITQGVKGLVSVVSSVTNALGGWQRILSVVKVGIAGVAIYKFSAGLFTVYQNFKLIKAALSIGWATLFSPITLISAALIGLFLVLEDFYVFSKGGKSVIGDIVNSDTWKKLAENIKIITEPFEGLKEMFEFLTRPDDNSPGDWQNFKDDISSVFDWFKPNDSGAAIENFEKFKVNERIYEPRVSNSRFNQSGPTFNTTLTINVPQGTTQSRAEDIATLVREEIRKAQTYSFEKMLNAIGGT